MTNPTLEKELLEQLDQLAAEELRQVISFARALATAHVRPVAGRALVRFAGSIPADDLAAMAQAIEDDCEHVNSDE